MGAKRGKKKVPPLLWRLLKRYLANSSIHGVGYLVEGGRHWTERLFWLITCGLSWWGCASLITGVVNDFTNSRTAVTVGTNYIDWPAELPSIHLCGQPAPLSTIYTAKTWPKLRSTAKLESDRSLGYESSLKPPFEREAFEGYYRALSNILKKFKYMKKKYPFPCATFTLDEQLLLNCTTLFEWCEWGGKEIECCEVFRPLSTRVGSCLSINSIFTTDSNSTKGQYESQMFKVRQNRSNSLKVRLRKTEYWTKFSKVFTIYLLSPTEIPSVMTDHHKKLTNKWKSSEVSEIDVRQQPIYNTEGVHEVPVEKRNCRFITENENSRIYRYYGYEACVAEADLKRMYDLCGCINHLNPRGPWMPICNQTELKCIWDGKELIYNDDYAGCVPDCEATEYTFFENYSEETTDEGAHFSVNLLPGPTIRYVRYVVHSKLDVVVSVGGALGLFVGASVLSIVEIPYWFLARSIDDNDEDDNGSVDDDHKNN